MQLEYDPVDLPLHGGGGEVMQRHAQERHGLGGEEGT